VRLAHALMGPVAQQGEAPTGGRGRSLEELLPALVRRIAWAGDRDRGTVRLELGAGRYAGATLVVTADGRRVHVQLGGVDPRAIDELRVRLERRLREHGVDLEGVE